MCISSDEKKSIWQNSTSIYKRLAQKLEIEELPQPVKGAFWKKLAVNIVFNSEDRKISSWDKQKRQKARILFNSVLQTLTSANWQEIWEEEAKVHVCFEDKMTVFIKKKKREKATNKH